MKEVKIVFHLAYLSKLFNRSQKGFFPTSRTMNEAHMLIHMKNYCLGVVSGLSLAFSAKVTARNLAEVGK